MDGPAKPPAAVPMVLIRAMPLAAAAPPKNADGKTGTADFLSGLISALPPLHELARNAGLDLPTYLGHLQREAERSQAPMKSAAPEEAATPKTPAPPRPKA